MTRPWPQDQVEHEMRSIRRFFRKFLECPEEFRINDYEGTFIRPSMRLVVVTSNVSYRGNAVTSQRTMTLYWFGTDSEDYTFLESEARSALDWLVTSVARGDEARQRAIEVYDWSNPNDPQPTGHVIDVDYASISGQMIRDETGLYSVPVDFRYNVRTRVAHYVSGPQELSEIDINRDVTI